MLPSIYGENMLDDFFGTSFFGGHDPLFGKHGRNLMKTDIRETDDAKGYRFAVDLPGFEKCKAGGRQGEIRTWCSEHSGSEA